MNCQDCKYYDGSAPGQGHHITCKVADLSYGQRVVIAMIVKLIRRSPIALEYKQEGNEVITPTLSEHGIRHGWCDWPINYDPIWVEDCLFFHHKNQPDDVHKNGKTSTI